MATVAGSSWAAITIRLLGRWSGEGLGLQAVELHLVDRAGIQQLLGPGDLVGRAGGGVTGGGDSADVAFELLLGLLLAGHGPRGHPLAAGEQVDEHSQEGQEHQEQHPQVLGLVRPGH
jgi:hypothetical protein